MKRLFVFVPAILLVLISSFFVLKGNEQRKKPAEEGRSFTGVRLGVKKVNKNKSEVGNVVLKSTDGGQTLQDISHGLPENLQREGVRSDGFFANDRGLYIRAGNGIYHNEPNSTTPFWTKEIFPGKQGSIAPGRNGIFAYTFRGQFLQKVNGKSDWSPRYKNFQEQAVRINRTMDWMYKNYKERQVSGVFETTGGTVFIGSNNAIFKSTNSGKTWKVVRVEGWVMKMAESKGVLLAAGSQGILRSTDDGETWDRVTGEGSVGIAVEPIDEGFAAIAYNAITQTNSVHISRDNGKTWKAIGEGFQPSGSSSFIKLIGGRQPSMPVLAIKQMGNYLLCSRTDGIFRSSDLGKTWKLLLPSVENRGFRLTVSGNVMYAMPNRGC